MSDDIRVGDRFEVVVEVTAAASAWTPAVVDGVAAVVPSSWLLSGKRLPRALKVGDWAIYTGDDTRLKRSGPWTITAIHGEWAWCHGPGSKSGELLVLSSLTPDTPGSPS